MNSNQLPKSRFCYAYTPPGVIDKCCTIPISATTTISSVIYNSGQTNTQSLLLATQQQCFSYSRDLMTSSMVQSTIANNNTIISSIYGQLSQIKTDRYEPYKPYVYPVIPQSVIDLQMNSANVGVPQPFFNCSNSKGIQFVTT
jgi:hypothetical protein